MYTNRESLLRKYVLLEPLQLFQRKCYFFSQLHLHIITQTRSSVNVKAHLLMQVVGSQPVGFDLSQRDPVAL